jgi:hypothetical protein
MFAGREVEATLKDGYRGDVDEYFGSLDQCATAIEFLRQHSNFKSAPKALALLEALLEVALREAASVVKEGFAKYAEPLDGNKVGDEIVLMKQSRIDELRLWIERLDNYKRLDYMADYVDKRSKVLADFMKKLIKNKRYDKEAHDKETITKQLLEVLMRVLAAERAL